MKDMENLKVQLFITESGFTQPSDEEIKVFRVSFDKAYMEARRATPGSIEALVRLREHGYRIAIICNGRKKDQREKVEAIGITNLVDLVITAENMIQRKPHPRAFRSAIGMLGVLGTGHTNYMVGCSPYYDIDGAVESGLGLDTILYWPKARNIRPTGREGCVIHHMTDILGRIGIARPQFELSFTSSLEQLEVTGIGMDIVTVARDGFRLCGYTAFIFTRDIGHVLTRISRKHFGSAMRLLEDMVN
ncbi:Had-superfamily subfamily variant 1 [Fusarium albosuccineum]|uniref:Had-superfamily subfamily variant 1 n=1 Tax=Fusarium albosuccineum TaxID=1237068 RepID=A0A8H4P280_9HYPO|nr:Had-superfamily subfamily variant 1 [Fusarium albosuccineum]